MYTITPSGQYSIVALANASDPRGLIADTSNNLFTLDYGANSLMKMNIIPASTTLSGSSTGYAFATTGSQPATFSTDASGNFYVQNKGDSTISKITPYGSLHFLVRLPGQMTAPQVDLSGNLYALDLAGPAIKKFNAAGVQQTSTSLPANVSVSTPVVPRPMAIDTDGSVILPYDTNPNGGGSIYSVPNAILSLSPSGTLANTSLGLPSNYLSSAARLFNFRAGAFGKILGYDSGVVSLTLTTTSSSGSSTSSVATTTINTAVAGTYVKHYTVTDSSGNKTTVYRTITVH